MHISNNRHTLAHIGTHRYTSAHISTHRHTSAHIGTHRHTSAHIGTHRHTSAHIGTFRHTSAHIGTHRHTSAHIGTHRHTSAHIRTHRHTSAYNYVDTHRYTTDIQYTLRASTIACEARGAYTVCVAFLPSPSVVFVSGFLSKFSRSKVLLAISSFLQSFSEVYNTVIEVHRRDCFQNVYYWENRDRLQV